MTMKLVCTTCPAKYTVPAEKAESASKKARCRKCGGALAVAELGARHDAPLALAAEDGGDERPARRRPREIAGPSLAEAAEARPIGHRNDTSVLFSLGAIAPEAREVERAGAAPKDDRSGLIDIRALSAAHGTKAEIPVPTVDDLVNLGGGGLAGASLLSAPDEGPRVAPSTSREGRRGVWIAATAGLVFFVIAVAATIVATRPPVSDGSAPPPPPRVPTVAREGVTEPAKVVAPPAPSAVDNVIASARVPDPAPVPRARTAPPVASSAVAIPAPSAPPSACGPACAFDRRALEPPTVAPFNRGAASVALASVAVASCKKPDGPDGPGHVLVTFEPDGTVSRAVVDTGSAVGTPVGGCIAGKFRAVKIPAFSGGAVHVGKSFVL